MEKTYFIAGDIHGHFDQWMSSLQDLGYDQKNQQHWIVVLGDLLDRGSQNYECLQFVNSLERKILVRGNHEELMQDLLTREWAGRHDISNGTTATLIECYKKLHGTEELPREAPPVIKAFREWEEWKKYYASLVDFYEDGDFVFVHGWVPLTEDSEGNTVVDDNWRGGNWSQAVWLNGMEEWSLQRVPKDKTVFCGHFHTSWGHHHIDNEGSEWNSNANFDPFVKTGIVAMDGCVALTKRVNVARLKGKELTFSCWEE